MPVAQLGSLPLASNGTHICTVSLVITCTPDLLESMYQPLGVSCPSTHHIHRQSMSIPKNVSVSQYGGNVDKTIRTFLEQKPTLCVCLLGEYINISALAEASQLNKTYSCLLLYTENSHCHHHYWQCSSVVASDWVCSRVADKGTWLTSSGCLFKAGWS